VGAYLALNQGSVYSSGVKPVRVENPPNPFSSTLVEYLEEPPEIGLEVYEDHSKSILAENDSPDVGFRYSVNPYRGCFHGCSYCLHGATAILMADGSTKPIADLRVGDAIYGTRSEGRYRRYVETRVVAHWSVVKPAYRVALRDRTALVTSGEHRFLTSHGWKHVARAVDGVERAQLCRKDELLGLDEPGEAERGIDGVMLKAPARSAVAGIEPLKEELALFDITTGTGDFIANGVVSHNCYARPSHEYLGFGSGVDFERRIVVKPQAPELLREAFEKKSWQGELVVVSGNTDCYQPLEASYELTRRCLQVCAEYRNPVHIITKSPLVERDIDVLGELGRNGRVGVSVSVPFWDEKNARVIEPYVATPKRRIETVRRLAAAGIPVTVNVAPVIPGLTDRDIA
jgi:DNA repair photolyase